MKKVILGAALLTAVALAYPSRASAHSSFSFSFGFPGFGFAVANPGPVYYPYYPAPVVYARPYYYAPAFGPGCGYRPGPRAWGHWRGGWRGHGRWR
jgi:hypothetical protein